MDWFNAGIDPLNWFESNRRVYSLSRLLKEIGTGPVKLLWERSRVLRRWRVDSEGGIEPVKELWERKRTLRLTKLERSGMGPARELFWRLRTRSWSNRVNVLGAKTPPKSIPSTTNRTTLACEHCTPAHLQNEELVSGENPSLLLKSAFDSKANKAEASDNGNTSIE